MIIIVMFYMHGQGHNCETDVSTYLHLAWINYAYQYYCIKITVVYLSITGGQSLPA